MVKITELRAFCLQCKDIKETTDFEIRRTDSGRHIAIGICPACKGRIQRLLRD